MDLKLIETGNGGDLVRKSRDLLVIEGLQNMPYLGMFGGNLAASTPTRRLPNEQALDFWANTLLFPNDPGIQFNSLTERALNNIPLTSSGRIRIENAVKQDLKFMSPFADVQVSVTIPDIDMVEISIIVRQLDNLQEREFIYIWDATRSELQSPLDENNVSIPVESGSGFDYLFDFDID